MGRLTLLFLFGFAAVSFIGSAESTILRRKNNCTIDINCLIKLLLRYKTCNIKMLLQSLTKASLKGPITEQMMSEMVDIACASENCKSIIEGVVQVSILAPFMSTCVDLGVWVNEGVILVEVLVIMINLVFLGVTPTHCLLQL